MGGDHLFSKKGYMMGFSKAVAPATMPGRGLDGVNRAAADALARSLDQLAAKGPTIVDLYAFVRHEIFNATTEATYGPHNPWRLPENEKTW